MINNKENVKKEIKSSIRSISILVISLIIINLGFSVASLFRFTDKRLIWTLDYGFYTITLSLIFSIIHYLVNQRKLHINVSILNRNEKINQITIDDKEFAQVKVEIKISGEYRKLTKPLEIVFPYWVDFQVKPKPFLKEIDNQNKCLIDLQYLTNHKKKITLKESITFDIISNTDEVNDDLIEPILKYNLINRLLNLNIKKESIKILNKGG